MKKFFLTGIVVVIAASATFGFDHIKNLEEFERKTARGNVIVEFYASWCDACKEMKRNLQMINRKKEKVKIYQVDIDQSQDVVDMYGTPQVPAILYMKDGEILQGYVGLKDMRELRNDIKHYFKTRTFKLASTND